MPCECKSQGEIQPRNPISPHFFIKPLLVIQVAAFSLCNTCRKRLQLCRPRHGLSRLCPHHFNKPAFALAVITLQRPQHIVHRLDAGLFSGAAGYQLNLRVDRLVHFCSKRERASVSASWKARVLSAVPLTAKLILQVSYECSRSLNSRATVWS